jgi:hypothetical protein
VYVQRSKVCVCVCVCVADWSAFSFSLCTAATFVVLLGRCRIAAQVQRFVITTTLLGGRITGLIDHAFLDILGQCDERLVHVDVVLGTGLQKFDAVLVRERFAAFCLHHLLTEEEEEVVVERESSREFKRVQEREFKREFKRESSREFKRETERETEFKREKK